MWEKECCETPLNRIASYMLSALDARVCNVRQLNIRLIILK